MALRPNLLVTVYRNTLTVLHIDRYIIYEKVFRLICLFYVLVKLALYWYLLIIYIWFVCECLSSVLFAIGFDQIGEWRRPIT